MDKKWLLDLIAVLDEKEDSRIVRQLCAILYRYLEKRRRSPAEG